MSFLVFNPLILPTSERFLLPSSINLYCDIPRKAKDSHFRLHCTAGFFSKVNQTQKLKFLPILFRNENYNLNTKVYSAHVVPCSLISIETVIRFPEYTSHNNLTVWFNSCIWLSMESNLLVDGMFLISESSFN